MHTTAPPPHHRASRTLALRLLFAALLLAGLGIGGWLAWFFVHSSTGGAQLLSQARRRIAQGDARLRSTPHSVTPAGSSSQPSCTPATGAVGELIVPSLGLVAPVVQGDGDAQLADAVGHVPQSSWPGGDGATVLDGHDVTWFSHLGQLSEGDQIEYESGCEALTYDVQTSSVVSTGTTVADTAGGLDLVTCWPLDALWFTGQRLLVTATLVGGAQVAPPVEVTRTPPVPSLAIPASLRDVDGLSANPTPLGTLTFAGSPSSAYEESPGPLEAAAAAQAVYFAAVRAAGAASASDWSVVAPGLPMSVAGAFDGATVSYEASLDTTLDVTGWRLSGATLRTEVDLAPGEGGGTAAGGTWNLTVTEGLVGGKLAVTGWQMSEAAS